MSLLISLIRGKLCVSNISQCKAAFFFTLKKIPLRNMELLECLKLNHLLILLGIGI